MDFEQACIIAYGFSPYVKMPRAEKRRMDDVITAADEVQANATCDTHDCVVVPVSYMQDLCTALDALREEK